MALATSLLQAGGIATVVGCVLNSSPLPTKIADTIAISDRNATASDTLFNNDISVSSSGGVSITHKFFNCRTPNKLGIGTLVSVTWVGGEIGTASQGATGLSIFGTTNSAWISAAIFGGVDISGTGPNPLVVNNTGQLGGNVNVTATVPVVIVTGDWSGVTFSGVAAALRRFQGSGTSIDFTGPGQLVYAAHGSGGSSATNLRGTGIHAIVSVESGQGIHGIGLIDSQLLVDFAIAASFTLDAASTRCLCVLSGTHQVGWAGTTDSGASNRIITETDDTFISRSATTSPSILNAEIAAVQSGVVTTPAVNPGATAAQLDAIRKDLVPADLVGLPGVQTIPTAVSSGATAAQLDALAKDFHEGFLLMGG